MYLNVNAIFQAQIANIAAFFEAPKRRFINGSTESKDKARIRSDEFVTAHPIFEVEETSTDNDIDPKNHFLKYDIHKDGWR